MPLADPLLQQLLAISAAASALPQANQLKPLDRQNPEDMFTDEQNLARNQAFAKPGPYVTQLPPVQEQQFQQWVKANGINFQEADKSYDMRGFWLAMQQNNPLAQSAVDPNDKQIHYPDTYKTPYAATFSNESQYALPTAPRWNGDQYVSADGTLIYDDKTGSWAEPKGKAR
jgi:hypothetical protein